MTNLNTKRTRKAARARNVVTVVATATAPVDVDFAADMSEEAAGSKYVHDIADAVDAGNLESHENLPVDADPYIEKIATGAWHGSAALIGMFLVLPGMGVSLASCGYQIYKGCIGATERDGRHPDIHRAKSLAHGSGTSDVRGMASHTIYCCKNLGCLTCLKQTLNIKAARITDRIMAYHKLSRSDIWGLTSRWRLVRHDIISPPPGMDLSTPKKWSNWMRRVYKILDDLGIEGGVVIPHAYRFIENLEAPKWSPHLHILSAGWTDGRDIADSFKRTGMLYRNIANYTSRGEVFGRCMYLLSHAAVAADRKSGWHTYRFFGKMQNRYFATADVNMASIEAKVDYEDRLAEWIKQTDVDTDTIRSRVVLPNMELKKIGDYERWAAAGEDVRTFKYGPVQRGTMDYPAQPEISATYRSGTLKRRNSAASDIADTDHNGGSGPGPPPEPPPDESRPTGIIHTGTDRRGNSCALIISLSYDPTAVCPTCKGTPHVLLPSDGRRVPGDICNQGTFENGEYVPPAKWFEVTAAEVYYADPRVDYAFGLPYFRAGHDTLFYDTGLYLFNRYYNRQLDQIRGLQCDAVIRSVSRHAACEYNMSCMQKGDIPTAEGRLAARRAAYADLESVRHKYTDTPALPPDAQNICSDIRDLVPEDLLQPPGAAPAAAPAPTAAPAAAPAPTAARPPLPLPSSSHLPPLPASVIPAHASPVPPPKSSDWTMLDWLARCTRRYGEPVELLPGEGVDSLNVPLP